MNNKPSSDSIEERLRQLERKVFLVNKDIFDIDEVSIYTGYKKNYIYKLCGHQKIPHYSPSGGKLFFNKNDIDDWLLSKQLATATQPIKKPDLSPTDSNFISVKYKKPTFKIILDTRHEKNNNSFAVKLRVTFNRISNYCHLQLYFTKDEWSDIKQGKEIRQFSNTTIHKIFVLAEKTLSLQTKNIINFNFSFDDFNREFLKHYFEQFKDSLSEYSDDSKLFTFEDIIDFANFCLDRNTKPSGKLLNTFFRKRLNDKLS